ncbi:hypothetical protein RRH01S_01_05230 [Rhizobium rhizogenes NBRC 13257]|uniref:Uncharacterized protein n=1 Tax=Rhizobium rhizogenes NBRC 13257 TaxID=1220581 RepID=A0AA87PZH4_RHIRH|nr:hypothetical protein RRH01S_01_05230 [Rhizobium rhizogenes NBRC 13257]
MPCPNCGHKTKKSIAWLKSNDKFSCDGCGRGITVQADELFAGIKETEKSIADLKKNLSRIGKRR